MSSRFDRIMTSLGLRSQERANDFQPWTRGAAYPSTSGQYVSGETALGLPAFYRAALIRCELISSMQLRAVDSLTGAVSSEQPFIVTRCDPTQRMVETISQIEMSLILRGNAYLILSGFTAVSDNNGGIVQKPTVAQVLNPDVIVMREDGNGGVWYEIRGTKLPKEAVLHIRSQRLPGRLIGIDPVANGRDAIGRSQAIAEHAGKSFTEGNVPSGVLEVDAVGASAPTEEQLRDIASQWIAKYSAGSREVVALPPHIRYNPLQPTNKDSQYIESVATNRQDMADLVGVPGYYLGIAGSGMTYSNVQDEKRQLITVYLNGHMNLIEGAFSDLLPRGQRAEFDESGLLRLDGKARAEVDEINLRSGAVTVDEIRARDGLPPAPTPDIALLKVANQIIQTGADPTDTYLTLGLPPIKFTGESVQRQQDRATGAALRKLTETPDE